MLFIKSKQSSFALFFPMSSRISCVFVCFARSCFPTEEETPLGTEKFHERINRSRNVTAQCTLLPRRFPNNRKLCPKGKKRTNQRNSQAPQKSMNSCHNTMTGIQWEMIKRRNKWMERRRVCNVGWHVAVD